VSDVPTGTDDRDPWEAWMTDFARFCAEPPDEYVNWMLEESRDD
jgi:hypothetical protein